MDCLLFKGSYTFSPKIVYFKDRLLRWIVYFQAKDRLLSGKISSTFRKQIVYFHPKDRLLSVGPDGVLSLIL